MSNEPPEHRVDEAEWSWLREHAERDVVIVVATELELAAVGEAVGADDAPKVDEWIRRGLLTKPTAEQLARWNAAPATRFLVLVRGPYVLVQVPALH